MAQATPKSRLRGEIALFWNPKARSIPKRWTPDPMEREWHRACETAGVSISLQEGTRHTTLTAFAGVLPERLLRSLSRHKDWRSLDRYAKPRVTRESMGKVLDHRPRPSRDDA